MSLKTSVNPITQTVQMNSSDFLKIHDMALAEILEPSFQYYYRNVCRWYSKEFHTPLHLVHTLPPFFVLQNFYEANLASLDEDDLDSLVFKALNPGVDQESEEEIQEFIDMIEREDEKKQKARLAKSGIKPEKESLEGDPGEIPSDESMVVRTYDEAIPPEAGLEDSESSDSTSPTFDENE